MSEWYSDAAMAKMAEIERLGAEGEPVPLTALFGLMEPRVKAEPHERCVCCGLDARAEVGGETHNAEPYCGLCIGRGHHE